MLGWSTTTGIKSMELPPEANIGWPASGNALREELDRPGRLMLVTGVRDEARALLQRLAALYGQPVTSVAGAALAEPREWSERSLTARLGQAWFLDDLECLCWKPAWSIDPIRFCRRMAVRHGVVAHWPGAIQGRRALFSAPGRPDFIDLPLADLVVLHAVPTRFPDETPFALERIPA